MTSPKIGAAAALMLGAAAGWVLGAGAGCATRAVGAPSLPMSAVASAYTPLDGAATASGRRLDWTTPTVAHRTLRFGTRMLLRYGRRAVWATVTDRGPFVSGRDLDLSPGAYSALGASTAEEWGVRTVRVVAVVRDR